ncbi:MAG TPA: GAF domain-containing protein [Thermoleophilaceae bacterium]|jgi:DNA-binding CsgD family transcriptional regulator|nr:GAF domain-containing protein [Thermoleophilaceae bacterium]
MPTENHHSGDVVRVRQALSKLRTSESLAELYERATRALCQSCGFGRAVLFRLQGPEMVPESVYFTDDPAWAEDFYRRAQTDRMRIDYDIVETEMISTRAPMIVPEAQRNPRGFKPLVVASKTRSYVAAPLIPQNMLIGFIHADRYFEERDVDEFDRDVLGTFAEGLGYAIHRTALLERVATQRAQIHRLRSVVDEMVTRVSAAVTVLDTDVEAGPTAPVLTVPRFEITRREDAILRLLDDGASDDEIAARLEIPRASVDWHLDQLMDKLGAGTPTAAVSRWRSLTSEAKAASA